MSWPTSYWSIQYSNSLISTDKNYIFSLSIYSNSTYVFYFNKFAISDGNVIGSRYVSNGYWADIIGSTQTGSNIVSLIAWSYYTIMIFDTIKYTFTFKKLLCYFYAIETEPLTGR